MPQPGKPKRSTTLWVVITGAVIAVIILCAVVLMPILGPRDEQSYEAGRSAAGSASTMIKFGGADPEDYCDGQFTLSTPIGEKNKYNRRDFMDGCLDAIAEDMGR
ncbi:hypothetical protein FHR72_004580 [Mycolicibacterium iranicum]|uniref:Uncharacterized protein n=1 Tax=Mycolicibacterium iranicum TaxID=912594 RepID=A0A839QBW6_MYCIR|nr:hypothetical protein [Mycolicibacterium iranicum]MBB2993073.1 hypothetical protein [Mycolicibacterium iranicum]